MVALKNLIIKFYKIHFYLNIYLGDKTIDFEARIVDCDKALHLGDLGIVPIHNT